jgi:hypothetical protein
VTLDLLFKDFKTKSLVNVYRSDLIGVLAVKSIELMSVNWADLKEMVKMTTNVLNLKLRLQFLAHYSANDGDA